MSVQAPVPGDKMTERRRETVEEQNYFWPSTS